MGRATISPRGDATATQAGLRDFDAIDSELRLVAVLRRAALERGGPMPSIDVADSLLDERSLLGAARAGVGTVTG